jgi:hypothetical protein
MATFPFLSAPLILIAIITIAIATLMLNNTSKQTKPKQTKRYKQYSSSITQRQYIPQYSPQMELDLRLPYKRFKQIHPNSNITYDEYKKTQMQASFKRSLSSQQNRRMVR